MKEAILKRLDEEIEFSRGVGNMPQFTLGLRQAKKVIEDLQETVVPQTLRHRFLLEAVGAENPPTMLAVAVKLPGGAIETIVNYHGIETKIGYYLSAYDNDFKLRNNPEIQIVGYMLV